MREVEAKTPAGCGVKFLYRNKLGYPLLRLLSSRFVSVLAGVWLDSSLSRGQIKKHIKRYGIDMSQYEQEKYKSFNSFFTRRIRPELRPFDMDENSLVSPCDGRLSAYKIDAEGTFNVKGFDYTVESLLKDKELAKEFLGGDCLIFRLGVSDYHHYFYIDDGVAECGKYIKGRFHTVRNIATENRKVYSENAREVTVLNTEHFGKVVQVEIGAMMVGRIVNLKKGEVPFARGEEKGYFEFGGSSIAVLLKKGAAVLDDEFWTNTANGLETVIKCGERIGAKEQ